MQSYSVQVIEVTEVCPLDTVHQVSSVQCPLDSAYQVKIIAATTVNCASHNQPTPVATRKANIASKVIECKYYKGFIRTHTTDNVTFS